jgi:hypothetical protein
MAIEDVTAHSFRLKITFGPARRVNCRPVPCVTETTAVWIFAIADQNKYQAIEATSWMS